MLPLLLLLLVFLQLLRAIPESQEHQDLLHAAVNEEGAGCEFLKEAHMWVKLDGSLVICMFSKVVHDDINFGFIFLANHCWPLE